MTQFDSNHREDKDLTSLEQAHAPTTDPFWQESWYFNFADAEKNVYGLTRIGYRPARNKADGLLLASVGGKPTLLYASLGRKISSAGVAVHSPDDLRVDNLRFSCQSPLDTWRLVLNSRRVSLDLNWTAQTPPYLYPEMAVADGRSAAAEHYEQAGRVSGHIHYGDIELTIDGLGQRDHSWGPRHWAGVGDWTWISAQFESGWAFNHWRLGSGPPSEPCGFIGHPRGNRDLVKAIIDWQGDQRGRKPAGARLKLFTADGISKEVLFKAETMWPLYKDGAVITETFGVCACDGEKGVGVVERLFVPRLGPLSLIPHVPKMAAMALYSR